MADPLAKQAAPKRKKVPVAPVDVVAFDTFSLFFRAFHALPGMSTSRGEPTSALYGFSAVVLKVLREHRPARLAFAVDAPQRTFRREKYEDYKAQRPVAHPELREQLGRLPALLEAFGVPVFRAPGFEADDLLATLARSLPENESMLVVSGDRDLLQVVNSHVRVLFLGARGKDATLFDPAAVEERFGVPPAQLPSFMALVGEPSDNLVGAPGVGPTTAAKLIREHGSVASLVTQLDQLRPGKVRDALSESAGRLVLNEELATLRVDAPLCEPALGEAPTVTLAAPLTDSARLRLTALFEELEFVSLIPRLAALPASAEAT
jgi:DNA polymerase-1